MVLAHITMACVQAAKYNPVAIMQGVIAKQNAFNAQHRLNEQRLLAQQVQNQNNLIRERWGLSPAANQGNAGRQTPSPAASAAVNEQTRNRQANLANLANLANQKTYTTSNLFKDVSEHRIPGTFDQKGNLHVSGVNFSGSCLPPCMCPQMRDSVQLVSVCVMIFREMVPKATQHTGSSL
jgi:hypothetical protein